MRSSLGRCSELAERAEAAIDIGHVHHALELANATLGGLRDLAWRKRVSRLAPLVALKAHKTLQNVFREMPSEQWKAKIHLDIANSIARGAQVSIAEVERLKVEELSVAWAVRDRSRSLNLITDLRQLAEADNSLREQYLLRKAEIQRSLGHPRAAIFTLLQIGDLTRLPASPETAIIAMEFSAVFQELNKLDQAYAAVLEAERILGDQPHDFAQMILQFTKANALIRSGEGNAARFHLRKAENLRLKHNVIMRNEINPTDYLS